MSLEDIDDVVIRPLNKQKIHHEGHNLSFIVHPDNPAQYLAIIQNKMNVFGYDYTITEHVTHLLRMDSMFQILETTCMNERTGRKTFNDECCGIQDCSLISEAYMTARLMDNNEKLIPTMALCHFDISNGIVDNIVELKSAIKKKEKTGKKWLLLQKTEDALIMIHSYDPLRIITANIETGATDLVHFQKIFNLKKCEIEGGASVYCDTYNKYLVNVRIVNNGVYVYSLWLLLSDTYKLCGMSKPFVFSFADETKNAEKCTCLLIKNDLLYASVTINDEDVFIYEYLLQDVYNKTTIDNMKSH